MGPKFCVLVYLEPKNILCFRQEAFFYETYPKPLEKRKAN